MDILHNALMKREVKRFQRPLCDPVASTRWPFRTIITIEGTFLHEITNHLRSKYVLVGKEKGKTPAA